MGRSRWLRGEDGDDVNRGGRGGVPSRFTSGELLLGDFVAALLV